MVVRRRIHGSRDNSVVRVFCSRYRIEASSGGWIDLEDSVARVDQGRAVSGGKESEICGIVLR